MAIYTNVYVNGNLISDSKNINIDRSISENNSTSSFSIDFDNPYGRHKTDFNLNDEVIVYADIDSFQSQTGEDDYKELQWSSWRSQTFYVTTSINLSGIKLSLSRNGTIGNVNIYIKATDVNNKPTGNDLATSSYNGDLLPNYPNSEVITFNFSEITLSANTRYCIIVTAQDQAVNQLQVRGATLSGETFWGSEDSGMTYNEIAGFDAYFQLIGITTPTTKLFTGIIEDIDFTGKGTKETLTISGRDYGAILQDRIINPRVFKNQEVSTIVSAIMLQNVPDITTTNVDVTTTTLDKITFSNTSVFDALKKLAELSNFIFYVDEDKDLHFEEGENISSGYTLDNTNIVEGDFRTADHEIFNRVKVWGDKRLTGQREFFTSTGGSEFSTYYKPHNSLVYWSGTSPIILQPGGVLNLSDPSTDNIKYLVNFQDRKIIFTSGTAAGDNTPKNGSVILIEYQKETPIIALRESFSSQESYGVKDKVIIDKNIKDPNEAISRANSILSENSNPRIEGNLSLKGVMNITPGNTVLVNLPNFNQSNVTYQVINSNYQFNPYNNYSEKVLSVTLNKKSADFIDIFKDQMIKIKNLEANDIDSNIVDFETAAGSVGVVGSSLVMSIGIGSMFYFNVPNHDIFNSPSSLLGRMVTGSTILNVN